MLEETIEHANIIIKEGIDREDDIQGILKKLLNQIQKQQVEIEKKDKIIDLMVPRVYLSEQERENMKEEYTWTSNKPKDFSNCVKQYFEKKAEE